jgi:hypothetical protein
MNRSIPVAALFAALSVAAQCARSGTPPTSDDSSSASEGPPARLFNLTASGNSFGASYYTPTQDHREIDVTAFDYSRAWRLLEVFEVQRRVGLFHASGTRSDAPYGVNPNSTATGMTFGPGVRLYPLYRLTDPVGVFVEGSAQILYIPGTKGFPAGGTGLNGFLRAGAGALFELNPKLAIDASYQWYSHVSNASGLSPQNPMWNGHGGTIALRRQF